MKFEIYRQEEAVAIRKNAFEDSRRVSQVQAHVLQICTLVGKHFPTHSALERQHSHIVGQMAYHMILQFGFALQVFATENAHE